MDIGILTIRDDEFRDVLSAFPDKVCTYKGTSRECTLRQANAGNGERYRVAVLRWVEQAHGEARSRAGPHLRSRPRLELVVGIVGGFPRTT